MMKNLMLIVVMSLLLCTFTVAQSGREVRMQELGLSFRVPTGWTGGIRDDVYMLGHSSIPGLIILTENKSRNGQQLKGLASQGISDEGVRLSPKGDFKLIGSDRVEGFYEGVFSGSNVRVFAIGLINRLGSGMNIFVVTEVGKFSNKHVLEAKKLARSVRFFQKKDSPETLFWKRRIVGKQLRYLKSSGSSDYDGGYNNTSDSVTIKLFTDGTFYYRSSSSGSFSGIGGSGVVQGKDGGKGRYVISTVAGKTYLELMSEDKTREYELTRSGKNYTLLNGSRYFVVSLNN